MKAIDILTIVQFETQVAYSSMLRKKSPDGILFARYVVVQLMTDNGISKREIGQLFNIHRTTVIHTLRVTKVLISNNRPYRDMYNACKKRMEDKAA